MFCNQYRYHSCPENQTTEIELFYLIIPYRDAEIILPYGSHSYSLFVCLSHFVVICGNGINSSCLCDVGIGEVIHEIGISKYCLRRRVINRWHCRQEMTIVSLQSFKKELILYPIGITISLYCTLHANMEDLMLSNILLIIAGIQIPSNL